MPKDTKTLGNNKARACESRGFVHKKGCARVLTQPRLHRYTGCYIIENQRELQCGVGCRQNCSKHIIVFFII